MLHIITLFSLSNCYTLQAHICFPTLQATVHTLDAVACLLQVVHSSWCNFHSELPRWMIINMHFAVLLISVWKLFLSLSKAQFLSSFTVDYTVANFWPPCGGEWGFPFMDQILYHIAIAFSIALTYFLFMWWSAQKSLKSTSPPAIVLLSAMSHHNLSSFAAACAASKHSGETDTRKW